MVKRRDLANAVRMLSVDAVQKANSGHPGMPMGMADIAEVLWNSFLKHNPTDPTWPNRDRFIVSNGHGCMLHYALLHLSGYDLSINDLRQFRQLHSKTPGHPEFGDTVGVETTTGPLGQGLANAVGMAIAEKNMAATFNRPGFALVDHYTYVLLGDGCLMEGISHEVCSLAGTYGLNKLIAIYDDNQISIDGQVSGWFTDNTPQRFQAYGWHVIPQVDGHDAEAIYAAIEAAKKVTDKPVLICCQTTIGFGSPNMAGTANTHGSPLGDVEIKAVRDALNWAYAPFEIPQDYYEAWDARPKGETLEQEWTSLFKAYKQQHPELAAEWVRRLKGELPANWQAHVDALVHDAQTKQETMATRKASQVAINAYSPILPEFIGGSADLTSSNLTNWTGMQVFDGEHPEGRYLHYGVREFGMSAIMNGLALYGGLLPFGGTFLTFSDYARNAVRLAALMRQRVVFVYTHDSIGLGEDGPTHQPIEQGPSLRMIPNLSVWRPCDTAETAVAWANAIEYHGPTCLLLSRQNLKTQVRDEQALKAIKRGGYILKQTQGEPHVILIATGSEVELAMAAAEKLLDGGVRARVVSMPSVNVFLAQSNAYREEVLPRAITARVAVEAAVSTGWYQFVGLEGKIIGIDRFGASAPAGEVYKECGITVDHIVHAAQELVNQSNDCHAVSDA